jgi:3-phenylpropionate/trans-cinnamate dioxygenase ferredoxin reductase subunit
MSAGAIVIVGAGQAAAVAAHALREHGWQGRITMLGRECHRPYERPPLSKAVLLARDEPELDVLPEEVWARSNIELLSGTDAIALNVALQHVRLADGRVLEYDKCLIATGGEAVTFPRLPRTHPRVHYLRTREDARRLRDALQHRPAVTVLGGGFLGLEVANSCLAAGASVSVIERATSLLDRFLPPEASDWLASELSAAGASLHLGTSLSSVASLARDRLALTTDVGTRFEADEVVVAVGLTPNDHLARDAGLVVAPGGGVLVDSSCRTSNEHVFACGDCTSQQRPGQTRPTRLESWQNANEQARTAAAAMLGVAPPVAPVPWFWTDQGRHNVQMLGTCAADLEYVRRGDPGAGKALWIGHRHRVPVHAVAINAPPELRTVRPLLERAEPVDLDDFTLESLNLRAWVKQALAGPSLATLSTHSPSKGAPCFSQKR